MAIPSRPPSVVVALPGQQRRVFSQQLLQAFDVVVVNDASSLRCRPLQTVAEAFAHFSGEVLPAGVAVLTRDHELRVALRQGQVDMSAGAPAHVRWQRRHRRRCRARVSLPVCGGTRETDEQGETSKRSLRPPFMNRLYPAETRLKEGANAHDSDQTGGSVPLPRVGGALSARSRQYQGTAASMSNAAKAGVVRSARAACPQQEGR